MNISFQYLEEVTDDNFNSILSNIIQPGIYYGGYLTLGLVQNTVTIDPFTIVTKYDTNKLIKIKTGTSLDNIITLNETITSGKPYITCSFDYYPVFNNYVNFAFKAQNELTYKDIIFGKGIFTSGILTSFDFSETTYGFYYQPVYGYSKTHVNNSGVINTFATNGFSEFPNFVAYEYTDLAAQQNELDNSSVVMKSMADTIIQEPPTHSAKTTDYEIPVNELHNNIYFSNEDANYEDITLSFAEIQSGLCTKIMTSEHTKITIDAGSGFVFYSPQLMDNMRYIDLPVQGCFYEIFCTNDRSGIIPKIYINKFFSAHGYHNAGTDISAYIDEYNILTDYWVSTSMLNKDAETTSFTLSSINAYLCGGVAAVAGDDSCHQFNTQSYVYATKNGPSTKKQNQTGFQIYQEGYLIGGTPNLQDVLVYSEPGASWASLANFPIELLSASACSSFNMAYITGGISTGSSVISSLYRYIANSNSWDTQLSMPSAKAFHTFSYMQYNIYAAGGSTTINPDNSTNVNTNYEYSIYFNAWYSKTALTTARAGLFGITTQNLFSVNGGYNTTTAIATTEVYRKTQDSWMTMSSSSVSKAEGATYIG